MNWKIIYLRTFAALPRHVVLGDILNSPVAQAILAVGIFAQALWPLLEKGFSLLKRSISVSLAAYQGGQ